jgi:hypothetical protein
MKKEIVKLKTKDKEYKNHKRQLLILQNALIDGENSGISKQNMDSILKNIQTNFR